MAERYADGWATADELGRADWDAEGAAFNLDYGCDPAAIQGWVEDVEALPPAVLRGLVHTAEGRALAPRRLLTRAAYFADFAVCYPHLITKRPDETHAPFLSPGRLRCLFANPLRPPAWRAGWRTADAVGVARGIDEGGDFGRLPVLADALMDAGCADGSVLAHCRGEGPHARGCWVVDWVLGRE